MAPMIKYLKFLNKWYINILIELIPKIIAVILQLLFQIVLWIFIYNCKSVKISILISQKLWLYIIFWSIIYLFIYIAIHFIIKSYITNSFIEGIITMVFNIYIYFFWYARSYILIKTIWCVQKKIDCITYKSNAYIIEVININNSNIFIDLDLLIIFSWIYNSDFYAFLSIN